MKQSNERRENNLTVKEGMSGITDWLFFSVFLAASTQSKWLSALTPTLSPRRGSRIWPRWKESVISECRTAHEKSSLSSGERAGVRASLCVYCIDGLAFLCLDLN